MKLTQLAIKPQLIKITLDDAALTAKYSAGEPIEFWTWDRQPLNTFMRLASLDTNDAGKLLDVVRTMILDEEGREIINDDNVLPGPVLMSAMSKITEALGK